MSIEDKAAEIKQSIGLYDLFGYLLPGFFFYALFIIDYDGSQMLRYLSEHNCITGIEDEDYKFKLMYLLDFIYYKSTTSLGLITFFIFVIFCYLSGHIMASYSSFIAKHTVRKIFSHQLLLP